ncbi:DUF1566 domain-containing protein [uncultured Desulfosarcina sp.]|uniref:Lcl domain-containing protein n=1 Tax=uncultured Desulfosarcina sp. TaxID=218289 RepID=UPI0029C90525|nr:DUF1566 domain-containing protein [uncultured Desulfosarcina sp.]
MVRTAVMTVIGLAAWLALAVGGVALAEDRFTDNKDGTVTDHQLGVMWAKSDNQGDIDWRQARQWIQFTFPYTISKTYDNWRMPTLKELASLYQADKQAGYETDCGQWVQITPLIRLSCGWVWSSDTSAIQAAIFNFHRGYHYSDRMAHKKGYRVLAVRDLQ